ncbi:MAG: Phosphomannomutase/phosphoglucomutase [Spirochaetes bacterium ADurb.Bin133]|nr:MAG: Phosphomannomutase/phosphoglucomutase [Spirochaetes bacterium ADurb.Bin133]
MSLKASISGIRGIVGDSLTPQILTDYLSAFSMILPEGAILIGRDSRVTGDMITDIVCGVMNFCGRDVVDIGIVPTPVVLFGVADNNYAGGIVVTASHNPLEWNALKLVNSKGKFISPAEFAKLSELYNKKEFKYAGYDKIGKRRAGADIPNIHIKKVSNMIDKEKVKKKRLRVALDTVNGAGGEHTIKLLKEFGCQIEAINIEPTGYFSHPPEPTPANLVAFTDFIKTKSVDIGFALDPDGDRLVLADSDGTILSEEYTLALAVSQYFKRGGKTDVVINTSTSRMVEEVVKKYGGRTFRVPTGEINVTEKMEEIGSKIGGEGNGGVIFPEVNKCRDASVGIALILEALSMENKGIKDLASEIPKYTFVKEKYSASGVDIKALEEKLRARYKEGIFDTQDGIRIDFKSSWALIRLSNTELIARVFVEAEDGNSAEELIREISVLCGFK